jgi:hypothetical protein
MVHSLTAPSPKMVLLGRALGPLAVAGFLTYLVCNWSQRDMLGDMSNTWAFVGLVLICALWDFQRYEVVVCIIGTYIIYDAALIAVNDLRLPNVVISVVFIVAGLMRLRDMQRIRRGGDLGIQS